jgi:hypothetical protein
MNFWTCLVLATISTTLENSIITERTTKNMAKYQKFVISFRVSFNNFRIHLLEFLNILHWFFFVAASKVQRLERSRPTIFC